ncbi:UNVERIFIED_CONTAM: Rhodanese-like domain-containing protein 9, chloroplastic [Sesamum latifolium]|uniref:Rhodanese-like domain-containing protein 9, chloroplastic n=1 Tax=Sesamum latifolium TaxID=2727402 RepID=A0AAW2XGY0_9LAMI
MAGMACCCPSALSSRSTSWLVVGTYQRRIPTGKRFQRRSLVIKAEVNFVNYEDAKKLIAVEGYAVVDVRDRTQFERAHIKGCYHVPLFIENTDNDLGTIKRTVHNNFSGLFFGLPFTKPNPEFVQSVKSQFSPGSKLLLVARRDSGTFDTVGSTELQNAGKAGLVTIQGKISAVLGTVLICAYLFITFFPDQAEKLLELVPSG